LFFLKVNSPSIALPVGIATLSRSLGDPTVVRTAQSLNLNLRDPTTLGRLLAEMNRYLVSSAEVNVTDEPSRADSPVPEQSEYIRNAIRTYREIEAMR
jgi:hypothetical protein